MPNAASSPPHPRSVRHPRNNERWVGWFTPSWFSLVYPVVLFGGHTILFHLSRMLLWHISNTSVAVYIFIYKFYNILGLYNIYKKLLQTLYVCMFEKNYNTEKISRLWCHCGKCKNRMTDKLSCSHHLCNPYHRTVVTFTVVYHFTVVYDPRYHCIMSMKWRY